MTGAPGGGGSGGWGPGGPPPGAYDPHAPPQQPYGAPQPQQPYGAPQPQQPYGVPQAQQPYGAPQPQQPYGAPQPPQPYGAPQPQQPYGAPQPQQPYGAPPQQAYGAGWSAQPVPQAPPPSPAGPQYRLERPGASAEEMFADDPEMLAMVRKARAERDPVAKPWWWQLCWVLLGAVGAAITSGVLLVQDIPIPHPLVPLSGFVGGAAFFFGAVGHRPGNFKNSKTDERLTLWTPMGGAERAAWLAGALVAPIAGTVLSLLQ